MFKKFKKKEKDKRSFHFFFEEGIISFLFHFNLEKKKRVSQKLPFT